MEIYTLSKGLDNYVIDHDISDKTNCNTLLQLRVLNNLIFVQLIFY